MAKVIRLRETGFFDGEQKLAEDNSSLEKECLMVYAGKFESMDGPVEIKDEDIDKLAANHNGFFAKMKRMATGDMHPKDNPPIQLDHSTSARDTVGRLIGEVRVGEHQPEGAEAPVKALFGRARILGAENVEKVKDGRWVHLSGGFDLENHRVSELTITPFPAAAEAHMLSKNRLARAVKEISYGGSTITIKEDPNHGDEGDEEQEYLGYVDGKMVCSYGDIPSCIEYCKERIDKKGHRMSIRRLANEYVKEYDGQDLMKRYKDCDIGLVVDDMGQMHWNVFDDYTRMGGGTCKNEADGWAKGRAFVDNVVSKMSAADRKTKLSSGEDTMGYKEIKEKADMYAKCKKHLMEEKKMSEEDADKHLESAKDEDVKSMAAAEDDRQKKMADEKVAADKKAAEEKEAEMKRMSALGETRAKIVELSKGLRKTGANVHLAARKASIDTRLSRLQSQAKISPAERKGIDIEKLAAGSDEALEAALSSYEKREPVIDVGMYGTTKALTAVQLKKKVDKLGSEVKELQTRLGMASKRPEALKRLQELGLSEADLEKGVNVHIDNVPNGEHDVDMEAAYGTLKKLWGEGKEDEAKAHFKKFYSVGPDTTMADTTVGPDQDKKMSALAAEVKTMQSSFDEVMKLAAPTLGIKPEELT